MFSFLDPLLIPVHALLVAAAPIVPPGLAVVLLTLLVRLALHPLNRRTQHQAVARRELQPRLDALRAQHKHDAQALQRATLELHREEGVPLAPGCLSVLIQLPVFGMIYRLFTAPQIGGHHNELLDHSFLGTPLSAHLATADDPHRWVFLGLIALTLLVSAFAAWQLRRHLAEDRALTARTTDVRELSEQQQAMADAMAQVTRVMPLLSFMTVVAVASVPLAAGLYLVTSSTWGLLERASLRRIRHGLVRR